MTSTTQTIKTKEELGKTQPVDASLEIEKDEKKKPRTRGLWLFDAVLYNLVNIVVFAISVYATYLTTNGGNRIDKDGNVLKENKKAGIQYTDDDGKLIHGKMGEFFHARGNWLMQKFEGWGMSHGQADMSKMVFFSFADGTLVAPLVKVLEDRREKIAYGLDKMMGTVPEDKSVYAAEPKQSWWSVITGRLATVSIVVPTAVILEKSGLNDKLFSNPGKATGERIAANPKLAKKFGTLDIPDLFKTVYFEAFYTTVCTVGLYFSSRFLANLGGKPKDAQKAPAHTETTPTAIHSVTVAPHQVADVVEAQPSMANDKKHASEKLKTEAPIAAAEKFSERPLSPAEQTAFVGA